MLEINFVLLISWCIFQDCLSEDCVDYKHNDIYEDCGELRIENGQVCYSEKIVNGIPRMEATIKCLEGFDRQGISIRKCTKNRNSVFTWDDEEVKCIQADTPTPTRAASITTLDVSRTSTTSNKTTKSSTTKFTSATNTITSSSSGIVTTLDILSENTGNERIATSGLVLKITIATAVLILVILLIATLIRWIKKNVKAKSKIRQNNEVLAATNDAYDGTVFGYYTDPFQDEAGINSSEYVYVVDRTAECHKVHSDDKKTNDLNNDSNQVHSNMYDVATTSFRHNAQRTTSTYSYLDKTNLGDDQSYINDEPGNVYNSLNDDAQSLKKKKTDNHYNRIQIDSPGVKMNENGMDEYFDQANDRIMEPAAIDIDAYAHAIKNL